MQDDRERDPGAAPTSEAAPATAHGVARGDRVHTFETDQIRVTWSRTRCTHVAACVFNLPAVFEPGRRPWVDLSQGTADRVARTIQRCPTGALHFERLDGGEAEPVPPVNTVLISKNGPIHLRGDIEVLDESGATLLRDTRVALCRCGQSAHRPLCDYAHHATGFKDAGAMQPGACVEQGETAETRLRVRPLPDGPVELDGPFAISSADGASMMAGTNVKLCRCGQSASKPYCDESHKRTGFRSA
jgi:CDGSH-type Zn-finger protein/uncharacterized Fe-S cluster protein YjdI